MHLRRLLAVVKFQIHSYNSIRDMNYYPVTDGQTDRQTDRKWCIWAHRAICTGGLKNIGAIPFAIQGGNGKKYVGGSEKKCGWESTKYVGVALGKIKIGRWLDKLFHSAPLQDLKWNYSPQQKEENLTKIWEVYVCLFPNSSAVYGPLVFDSQGKVG